MKLPLTRNERSGTNQFATVGDGKDEKQNHVVVDVGSKCGADAGSSGSRPATARPQSPEHRLYHFRRSPLGCAWGGGQYED
ncbi:MAG: hypothetical protein LC778_08425 [Acidobacteria bacterium]|nr:hypothetical protein [Acidobacteriota bacterium]